MAAAGAETTWSAGEPTRPALHALVEALGRVQAIDKTAEPVAAKIRSLVPPGALKDALSGVWLGHALHPLLTDVPIGTWTSATLLDVLGGRNAEGAADKLIGIGLLAAVPTALTGATDWADSTLTDVESRRVGAVHAVSNTLALLLYGGSLAARRRGDRGRGRLLALVGAAALGAGGHLGGHLSYARGLGVRQTAFDLEPTEWTVAISDGPLADGDVRHVELNGTGVMITRQNGRVHALNDRCVHRGGPLHEGEIADGCVTCPWHQSIFSLADGSVVQGPAAYSQPVWDVRERDGSIEVRARPEV